MSREVALQFRWVCGPLADQVIRQMVNIGSITPDQTDTVQLFREFVDRYHLDISDQPAAMLHSKPVGYCLFMKTPGGSGTVMLPASWPDLPTEYDTDRVVKGVLELSASRLMAMNLAFVQALVDAEDQHRIRLFLDAGFELVAELVIMDGLVIRPADHPDDRTQWLAYRDDLTDRFGETIMQTYQDSLDCPKIVGIRTADEVINGHRYSGLFEPRGWWLMRIDERDAGVLLLNATEEDTHRLELVYMGLAPWARGRRLGTAMMHKAMTVAHQLKKTTIRVAVDARNTPALKLYQRFGFQVITRHAVLAVLNETRRRTTKNNNKNQT